MHIHCVLAGFIAGEGGGVVIPRYPILVAKLGPRGLESIGRIQLTGSAGLVPTSASMLARFQSRVFSDGMSFLREPNGAEARGAAPQLHTAPRHAPRCVKGNADVQDAKRIEGQQGQQDSSVPYRAQPVSPSHALYEAKRSMKQTLAGKRSWLIVSYRALAIRADLAAVAWVPRGYKYGTQSSTLGFQTVIF